jgi:hypothetical protein
VVKLDGDIGFAEKSPGLRGVKEVDECRFPLYSRVSPSITESAAWRMWEGAASRARDM